VRSVDFRTVLSQFAPWKPLSVPVSESQDTAAQVTDVSRVAFVRSACCLANICPDRTRPATAGEMRGIHEGVCLRWCRNLCHPERLSAPITTQIGIKGSLQAIVIRMPKKSNGNAHPHASQHQ